MKREDMQNIGALFDNLVLTLKGNRDIDRDFDYHIGNFVSQAARYKDFEKFCSNEIDVNRKEDGKRAYIAFFALNTHFRRSKRIADMGRLLDRYMLYFKGNPSFAFLQLLYDMHVNKDRFSCSILKKAEDVCEVMEYNVNVLHAYAEIVANNYEVAIQNLRKKIVAEHLQRAYDYIERALFAYPNYAKYYCTKARILMIKADVEEEEKQKETYYIEALEAINYAFNYESNGTQFLIRMEEYERYEGIIKIKFNLFLSQENEKRILQKQLQESYAKNSMKNFEILGLFTAILSFTIGTMNNVKDYVFHEAAYLIITLTGAILIIYAMIGVILHPKEKQHYIVLLFGIMMDAFAIYMGG